VAYGNLDQLNRAISDFDQAIRLDSNYAVAYNNRGGAYLMLNNTQKGCTDLDVACKLGICNSYDRARQQNVCW
jgi:tetratricopeptide (TPR) repeat protein